jgi:hypothetical protein
VQQLGAGQKGGQGMKHRIEMVAIWFANRSMAD